MVLGWPWPLATLTHCTVSQLDDIAANGVPV